MNENLMYYLCLLIGHKTVRSGVMRSLCMRCDTTIYDRVVAVQGKRHGRRNNAEVQSSAKGKVRVV